MSSEFVTNGFTVLKHAYTNAEIDNYRTACDAAFQHQLGRSESVRDRDGSVYAARNVLDLWPEATTMWRKPALIDFLKEHLGPDFGLVRGLYFDKPPEQTWALPWHKDLLIAIDGVSIASPRYSKPRLRAGIPHTEPPLEVLEAMLTLRIHFDDATDENGPLEVLPGSHRTGKQLRIEEFSPVKIFAQTGDVLAMRPLLAHSSGRSLPGSTRHRRVLHLEFSGMRELPEGVKWSHFDN